MIILRHKQKDFSTKLAQAALVKEKGLNLFRRGAKKKTLNQMRRGAINDQNKVIEKVAKTELSLQKAALNPGEAVASGVGAAIENPVAVGSNVAGKALMVAPVDPIIKATPIGAAGVAAEAAMKKKLPGYARATKNAAEKFKNSKAFNVVKNGANLGVDVMRNFAG